MAPASMNRKVMNSSGHRTWKRRGKESAGRLPEKYARDSCTAEFHALALFLGAAVYICLADSARRDLMRVIYIELEMMLGVKISRRGFTINKRKINF